MVNIAKATKENIVEYNLHKNHKKSITVIGNGTVDCRISKKDNQIQLFLNNEIDYIDLSWGNYQHNLKLNNNYSNEVLISIQ